MGDNNLSHRNLDREKSRVTGEPSSLKRLWAAKCRVNAHVGSAPGTASAPPEVAQDDSQEVLRSKRQEEKDKPRPSGLEVPTRKLILIFDGELVQRDLRPTRSP